MVPVSYSTLIQWAMNEDYDLLLLGTRGAGLTRALLGSTAAEVSEDAKIPVLLMSEGAVVAQG